MIFHGFKYPAPESDPPIGVELYSNVEARDRRLAASAHVPGIEPIEAMLEQLSDEELSQTFLRVAPHDPNFSAMTAACFEEKASRLKKVVKEDVDRALATGGPINRANMIWTTRYLVANAVFSIGVNGDRLSSTLVLIEGGMGRQELQQLSVRAGLILTRYLTPVILRLSSAPLVLGGTDVAQ